MKGLFITFEGGEGVVEEINTETGDIKITATLFGRPTTVEVKYSEIEKI